MSASGAGAARATSGSATAPTSPGATRPSYTLAAAHACRQRRAVPRRRHQRAGQRHEQRRDADRHDATGRRPPRSPSPPAGGACTRRRHDRLRGHARPTPRTARSPARASPGGSTSTTPTTSHPFLPPTSGSTGGSFAIPIDRRDGRRTSGTAIHLTVTRLRRARRARRSATCSRARRRSTLATSAAGLRLELDGQPRHRRRTPYTGVVGHAAQALGAVAAGGRRPTSTSFAVVVRRRGGDAHDLHAGERHDLHGQLPPDRAAGRRGDEVGAAAGRGARAGPGALAPRHPRAVSAPAGTRPSGDAASRRAPAGRAAGDGRRRRRPAGPPARHAARDPGAGRGVRDRATADGRGRGARSC